MTFHPLEEEFDLPPHLVEHGDLQCGEDEIVRKENVDVPRLRIDVLHASEECRIMFLCLRTHEPNRLVTAKTCRTIDGARVETLPPHVALCSRNEEGLSFLNLVESSVIDIPTIHDVARTEFNLENVEDVHVVHGAIGDVDEGRKIAAKIEEHMRLYRCLRLAESAPTETRRGRGRW